ncbi:MAG TPA: alpha amylase C-terminal domain-containing protein, partial [Gemmataceae bacterium]|nr:alpha amylase C-terminal domain-containing protein [Gemmataceae bacterium]
QITHVHDDMNMLVFRRWMDGGPGDDVMIVANFQREPRENYTIGFPVGGAWKLLLNSDWTGYSEQFTGYPSGDVVAEPGVYDGLPFKATIRIGPYSVLIYSQPKG